MKSSHLLLCVAGIFCSPSAAAAPINFSCSAPLGRNSEIWQSVTAPAFRVRGRIVPIRLERLPADPLRMDGHDILAVGRGADVMIGRRSDQTYMTLGVGAELKGQTLVVRLVSAHDGLESDEAIASLEWSPGSQISIPFEFFVEKTQTIMRVQSREFRFEIGSDPNSEVRFGCTGGTFDFYELEISR